jgi:hypothetical protein
VLPEARRPPVLDAARHAQRTLNPISASARAPAASPAADSRTDARQMAQQAPSAAGLEIDGIPLQSTVGEGAKHAATRQAARGRGARHTGAAQAAAPRAR